MKTVFAIACTSLLIGCMDPAEDADDLALGETEQLTICGTTDDSQFVNDYNGTLVFQGFDEAHGRELWTSDGTEVGTRILDDVNLGPGDSEPHAFAVNEDALFFMGTTSAFGREPMRFDPPPAPSGVPGGPLRISSLPAHEMREARLVDELVQ